MASLVHWVGLSMLALSASLATQTEKNVREVVIHSGWGGLGNPQRATVTILATPEGFQRDGEAVSPALVRALLAALEAPGIDKPSMDNLGVTATWLKSNVASLHPMLPVQGLPTTASQKDLFTTAFTNPEVIAKVLPSLFSYTSFDDYPWAEVEVTFQDGSKLVARSHSYYVFMLPWNIDGRNGGTYNADISRAVSALLPRNGANKERLRGNDFLSRLADAVMGSIEVEWNLRGAQERVGNALDALRANYQVTASEIGSWHHPEYGTATYKGEPEEMNLHATIRKATFPPNVSDALVLRYVKGNVEGVRQFLKAGGEYEDLALSVQWLNKYVRENPKIQVRISYVHDRSFGDKAMRTFAADMMGRGRGDLTAMVRAQQSQIALLIVGTTYAESYWLVFPDRHLMLWRYGGPSGLLKWTPNDFGEGACADYRVNNGGCSGREVSPEGMLIPDRTPRDVECMNKWRRKHASNPLPTDALFEVEEDGREGFIDRAGQVAIPLCFDAVGEFSEGLARFERDGRWGYIDSAGNIIIQPTFPWAEEFHEGLAHVQATGTVLGYDGRWGYIDQTGRIAIPPSSGRMIGDSGSGESAFHEGLAMIEVEGKSIPPRKGFIDKTGKLVIPARFTYVYPFSDGMAAATESESGETGWGYIDKTGNWAIPPTFDWASSFQFGLAPVNRKKDCGYIDRDGNQVLRLPAPGGHEDCASAWGDFTNGLSRWLFGKKYGFIDRSGKTVIASQFDLTYGFSEGLAAVQVGKKWGYIDTTGKMVIAPQELWNVKPFRNGLAEVQTKDGSVGYIDRSGKYVWGPHKRNEARAE